MARKRKEVATRPQRGAEILGAYETEVPMKRLCTIVAVLAAVNVPLTVSLALAVPAGATERAPGARTTSPSATRTTPPAWAELGVRPVPLELAGDSKATLRPQPHNPRMTTGPGG